MNPEIELTGTPKEVATEIANACIRKPSYKPNPDMFKSYCEWQLRHPNGTYYEYKFGK